MNQNTNPSPLRGTPFEKGRNFNFLYQTNIFLPISLIMKFSIILAVDSKNWIWKDGTLAWKLSKDMRFFKEVTTSENKDGKLNAVIMWRKTRESIPEKFRPLSWRINCILTNSLRSSKTPTYENDKDKWAISIICGSFGACIKLLEKLDTVWNIFIIGWANLYNSVLDNPFLERIYITKIEWDFGCDVFFNWIPNSFKPTIISPNGTEWWINFKFEVRDRNTTKG